MDRLGRFRRALVSTSGIALLVVAWQSAVTYFGSPIIPGPGKVVAALAELLRRGLLPRHVVASLFRVTYGYLAAASLAVPFGLCLGWFRRGERALNPLLQIFRPISPLAWIPISILWFGVGDAGAIFIIFIACFFPVCFAAMSAVGNVSEVHLNAARNFGFSSREILVRVVFPSVTPQLIEALRLTLGIAWLVVVAAEMIAVNSGLGFLIIDSRNAGNRYDLVIAGMVLIGLIGLLLDAAMRRLERSFAMRPLPQEGA